MSKFKSPLLFNSNMNGLHYRLNITYILKWTRMQSCSDILVLLNLLIKWFNSCFTNCIIVYSAFEEEKTELGVNHKMNDTLAICTLHLCNIKTVRQHLLGINSGIKKKKKKPATSRLPPLPLATASSSTLQGSGRAFFGAVCNCPSGLWCRHNPGT